MTETRRRSGDSNEQRRSDSGREFLEASHVNDWMTNVLSQLVANKPEDPIPFLAQFFENLDESSSNLNQTLELVKLSHHSSRSFPSNVTAAYELLSQPRSSNHPAGIVGSTYKTLLERICSSVPVDVKESLLKKVCPKDFEFVPLDVFHNGVLACFLLKEYIDVSVSLFEAICSSNNSGGVVHRDVSQAVITEFKEIIMASCHLDPRSYVTVGRKLHPDYLALALEDAQTTPQKSQKSSMDCDEFVKLITQVFIAKVKPLS